LGDLVSDEIVSAGDGLALESSGSLLLESSGKLLLET